MTWWLAPFFRQRYSDVWLDESNMIVKSGRCVTAGAALSHMDLALWLVRSVLGKSPLSYVQSLRVERAVHLLKTSDMTVDDVAARVGYADAATRRTLLRRQLHVGVRQIRAAH